MNHQLYETWIFADEPLTDGEKSSLAEHLAGCPDCQAVSSGWRAADSVLRKSETRSPAEGFPRRWQERLEMERARLQKRNSIIMFCGYLLGMAAFASPILLTLISEPESTVVALWRSLYHLMLIFEYTQGIFTFLRTLFSTLESILSPSMAAFLVFMVMSIDAGWFLIMRQLSSGRAALT